MRIKVFSLTAVGLAFFLNPSNGVKLNEENSFQEELAEIDSDGNAPADVPVAAPIQAKVPASSSSNGPVNIVDNSKQSHVNGFPGAPGWGGYPAYHAAAVPK